MTLPSGIPQKKSFRFRQTSNTVTTQHCRPTVLEQEKSPKNSTKSHFK